MGTSMYAKSKRTGKYAEIRATDESGIILAAQGLPVKKVTHKMFDQNWDRISEEEYKQNVKEEAPSMPSRSEISNATTIQPNSAPAAQETKSTPSTTDKTETTAKAAPVPATPKEAAAEAAGEKKKAGRASVAGDHPLWFAAKNFVEGMGGTHEVGAEGKVKGFRSFKVDNHMFCNITYNKNGVTLWVRSAAVEDVKLPAGVELRSISHMFDGRIHFGENTPENIKAIQAILTASSKYQQEKKASTAKAQANKRREEKAAAKAAKLAEDAKKKNDKSAASNEAPKTTETTETAPTTK